MGSRLSAVDSAWLHMEEPGNLMNINGVFVVDGPLRPEAVRQRLCERLLEYEPFLSRVVDPGARRPRWERDPDFDLDRHVIFCEGPLMKRVEELLSRPLDRSHPLWQMHCLPVENGWALIARLHHVIGDGVALMQVLGHMADRVPTTYRAPHLERRHGPRPWARSALDLVSNVLRPEPGTALKGRLGKPKRAVVSPPLDLGWLRTRRQQLGCTLNDLLLEAVTASLRGYLGRAPQSLRAVMPVDLRRPGDERLGNRFGLAFVTLPVGLEEREARLTYLRHHLDGLKHSVQPLLLYGVLGLAGLLPTRAESALVRFFGTRATAVVTNVPGPREPIEILGQPLRDLMFWVPQSGRLALGISLISYAGTVRIGVASDAGLIPDPERIVEGFMAALA